MTYAHIFPSGVVQVRQVDSSCTIIHHPIRGSISDSNITSSVSNCKDSSSSTTPSMKENVRETCPLTSSKELRVQLSSCNEQRLLLDHQDLSDASPAVMNMKHTSLEQTTSNPVSVRNWGFSSQPCQKCESVTMIRVV